MEPSPAWELQEKMMPVSPMSCHEEEEEEEEDEEEGHLDKLPVKFNSSPLERKPSSQKEKSLPRINFSGTIFEFGCVSSWCLEGP